MAKELPSSDIHEITEKLARVNLNSTRDVQFFVTCSYNHGDCDHARELLREHFMAFATRAPTYLRSELVDDEAGGSAGVAPVILPDGVSYRIECGERRRRAHLHAIISCRGQGKVFFDLAAIRKDFPGMYWNFRYVRRPRTAEETMGAMLAYAGKGIATVQDWRARNLQLQHATLEELVDAEGVTRIGTTNDIQRARRLLAAKGIQGHVMYTELQNPDDYNSVLTTHTVWTRRPKKTAKYIFVVSSH